MLILDMLSGDRGPYCHEIEWILTLSWNDGWRYDGEMC